MGTETAHDERHRTTSGVAIEPVYGPDELKHFDRQRDLGLPGGFPYTRGIHPDMYRRQLWTMRQFSGFATPDEPTAAITIYSSKARRVSRWRSISPP